MKTSARVHDILRSGLIFTAISFVTSLGHMAFQIVIGRHLSQDQYGTANSAVSGFLPLLGLLPAVATFAVTHYIAQFSTTGDHDRLRGLLQGCRKFLFWLTLGGSVLVLIVIKPLSDFFHFGTGVMLVTLLCTLMGLWGSYVTALCQGLAWFKRLALIGFLTMALRFTFGYVVVLRAPVDQMEVYVVLATACGILANLVLLFWWRDLAMPGQPASPLNQSFFRYLIVSTAYVVGSFCFMQGDVLVAKKFFAGGDNGAYNLAKQLAVALPTSVAPLLQVLFTSRSGSRSGSVVAEQMKLLGIYVLALLFGAGMLYELRGFCVHLIWGHSSPEAEMMIGHLAVAMTFVGLLQALAQWSLASRWSKVAFLYGGLGVIYSTMLYLCGHSVDGLLLTMSLAAGGALAVLFGFWFYTMLRHRTPAPQS